MKTVMFGLLVVALVLGGVGTSMYFSYSNREVQLRNLASAQEKANQAIFDKVWKVISQKAQVTDKYSNDFKSIYTGLMSGRYSKNDKVAWQWIQEHNPQIDSKVYNSLMDTIEGLRTEFAQVQIKLTDIKREHDNLRTTYPAKWFIGSRPELKITIVTSENTEKAFSTGKEDNVKLF